MTTPSSSANPINWQAAKDIFHAYATWLVSISWMLFWGLSIVLLTALGILQLPQLAFLIILTSIVIKATFKQQIQAEQKATAATYLAEAEQLVAIFRKANPGICSQWKGHEQSFKTEVMRNSYLKFFCHLLSKA